MMNLGCISKVQKYDMHYSVSNMRGILNAEALARLVSYEAHVQESAKHRVRTWQAMG